MYHKTLCIYIPRVGKIQACGPVTALVSMKHYHYKQHEYFTEKSRL